MASTDMNVASMSNLEKLRSFKRGIGQKACIPTDEYEINDDHANATLVNLEQQGAYQAVNTLHPLSQPAYRRNFRHRQTRRGPLRRT